MPSQLITITRPSGKFVFTPSGTLFSAPDLPVEEDKREITAAWDRAVAEGLAQPIPKKPVRRGTRQEQTARKVEQIIRSEWPQADIETTKSRSSEACYIEASFPDYSMTVRVAKHETGSHYRERLEYSEPDIDIGPHNEGVEGRAARRKFATLADAESKIRDIAGELALLHADFIIEEQAYA